MKTRSKPGIMYPLWNICLSEGVHLLKLATEGKNIFIIHFQIFLHTSAATNHL